MELPRSAFAAGAPVSPEEWVFPGIGLGVAMEVSVLLGAPFPDGLLPNQRDLLLLSGDVIQPVPHSPGHTSCYSGIPWYGKREGDTHGEVFPGVAVRPRKRSLRDLAAGDRTASA